MFVQAPLLGSLIEPTGGDLVNPARLARLEEMLETVIAKTRATEPERNEGAVAARGMADAAAILARRFVLVITNVPFLSASKQNTELRAHIRHAFNEGKADLATALLLRVLRMCTSSGSAGLVTPQNWYSLRSYRDLRESILTSRHVILVSDLGPAAFHDMNWWAARTALTVITNERPSVASVTIAIASDSGREPEMKALNLRDSDPIISRQYDHLKNPDARITVAEPLAEHCLVSMRRYTKV
jgi:hypothetical protein